MPLSPNNLLVSAHRAGFGQPELAQLLGVSRQSVNFYINAKVRWAPSDEQLDALYDAVVTRHNALHALALTLKDWPLTEAQGGA